MIVEFAPQADQATAQRSDAQTGYGFSTVSVEDKPFDVCALRARKGKLWELVACARGRADCPGDSTVQISG